MTWTPAWSTNMTAAPRGEDILVTINGRVDVGQLIFEPYEREDDDDEPDCGYWGDINGMSGMWCWHVGCDEYVDKKWLTAWAPLPAAHTSPSEPAA